MYPFTAAGRKFEYGECAPPDADHNGPWCYTSTRGQNGGGGRWGVCACVPGAAVVRVRARKSLGEVYKGEHLHVRLSVLEEARPEMGKLPPTAYELLTKVRPR